MNEIPINRTCSIIEQTGRRKKVEISVKRRFYRDWNTGLLVPIDCNPQDAHIYSGYKFEVINHDLHLAFAPSSKRLPFLRITDPQSNGSFALWFMGFGNNITPSNPLLPELVDKGNNFVQWQLDNTTSLKLEILGHLIRKLIILDKRPSWNSLKFRIARGNANLIDGNLSRNGGMAMGETQRRLMAFRKNANIGLDFPLFWFTEPNAYDSSGNIDNGFIGEYTKPTYTLTPISTGVWELTIEMDANWLDSAKYPVYIDPTIVLQPDAAEGLDVRLVAAWGDSNREPDDVYSAYHSGSNVQYELNKFDLSSIPTGSTINSAVLYLVRWDTYYLPHQVQIGRTLKDWVENEATWKRRTATELWDNLGGDYEGTYADEGSPNYLQEISLETASLVQLWVDGTYPNYGYHVRDARSDDNGSTFCSSDHADPTKYPKLTIDYTGGGENGLPAKIGALAGLRVLNPLATGLI